MDGRPKDRKDRPAKDGKDRPAKDRKDMELDRRALDAWTKDKPLSVLQLDPADRAVLKIAGACVL